MISKLPNVGTTIFTKMSQLAAQYNALNLSQGFPDFDVDPELTRLVAEAMKAGRNQYAPMQGVLALRERIADKLFNAYQREYDPNDEIVVTAGATQAIFTALAAIIHPGDEVIIFAPAYDCYEPAISLFGGVAVEYQLEAPSYQPVWSAIAQLITPKTKVIMVNSPHNPSGMCFGTEDMKTLAELAEAHDLIVISDEVYEHILFDGIEHQSAALFNNLASRSFIVASFGKTFHVTGWKVGYCVGPEHLMKEFKKVHQYNVFSVHHPTQYALAEYLLEPERYLGLSVFFQEKRDLFLDAMSGSRFKWIPSEGTYFQLLDYTQISDQSDVEFAQEVTIKHGVATIPTSVFNKDKRDFKQVRICFAKKPETLLQAAQLLCKL